MEICTGRSSSIRRPRIGINPILGMEAYIAPGSRFHKEASGSKEAKLPSDAAGPRRRRIRNLVQLSSSAFLERVLFQAADRQENCWPPIARGYLLSGCASSELSRTAAARARRTSKKALEIAALVRELFGDDYYIEIQNKPSRSATGGDGGSIAVAKSAGIPWLPQRTSTTSTAKTPRHRTFCCA